MSSAYVRTQVASFIAAQFPTDKWVDLTAEFRELADILAGASITRSTPWFAIQYVGSEEVPVDVGATNTRGTYREVGVIYIHVVDVAKIGTGAGILIRCETVRNKFRGQRLGNVVIEGVSPANFEAGGTLQFENGWTSASVLVSYHYDLNL